MFKGIFWRSQFKDFKTKLGKENQNHASTAAKKLDNYVELNKKKVIVVVVIQNIINALFECTKNANNRSHA